jgi:alcohol dehydrogenase
MRNNISIHGQWMYDSAAVTGMVRLVHSGLLDLEQFAVTEFSPQDVNEAVAHAASNAGPFKLTALKIK